MYPYIIVKYMRTYLCQQQTTTITKINRSEMEFILNKKLICTYVHSATTTLRNVCKLESFYLPTFT